jgi:hypothetical protein
MKYANSHENLFFKHGCQAIVLVLGGYAYVIEGVDGRCKQHQVEAKQYKVLF